MADPCPEALEIARQVADSWRADGRLGQLESHIAPAIQKLIEQREKFKGQYDDLRVALEVALKEPRRAWPEYIDRLLAIIASNYEPKRDPP